MARFSYGGQALIEGVLMRGRDAIAVALRHPDGRIVWADERLAVGFRGTRWARLPFVRGLVVLYETLVAGPAGWSVGASLPSRSWGPQRGRLRCPPRAPLEPGAAARRGGRRRSAARGRSRCSSAGSMALATRSPAARLSQPWRRLAPSRAGLVRDRGSRRWMPAHGRRQRGPRERRRRADARPDPGRSASGSSSSCRS